MQLDLPLGLADESRRPGSRQGLARWTADRAVDAIRDRFGWEAVGYGSVALGLSRSVPDAFRELAEKGANTLVFPTLTAGNIAYKLLQEIGGAEAIGPILMGMRKPVHILQLGSSIREIVNMVAIAVVDAQNYNNKHI